MDPQITGPDDGLTREAARSRPRTASQSSQGSEGLPDPHPLDKSEWFMTEPVPAIPFKDDDGSFPEENSEERFANLVKYFEDLERLEQDIINRSSLPKIYDQSPDNYDVIVPMPSPSSLETNVAQSDDVIIKLCPDPKNKEEGGMILSMLRCRNIAYSVYESCCK
jgi:hypothetical protein